MTRARISPLLFSLAITAGSLLAPAAEAAVVQVSVAGTITAIDNHSTLGFNNPTFSNLALGDTVTGSWSYDTSTPFGVVPISGSPLGYFMPGGLSFSTGGTLAAYATFTNDTASFLSPGTGRVFPESAYSVSLHFTPNYFDGIPPSALDTSALLFGSIFGTFTRFPGNFISFSADVTRVSSVPIPAAAWLFGSALLGVLGFRRFAPAGTRQRTNS